MEEGAAPLNPCWSRRNKIILTFSVILILYTYAVLYITCRVKKHKRANFFLYLTNWTMLLFLVTLQAGVVIITLTTLIRDYEVNEPLIVILSYMKEMTRTVYIFVGISYYVSFCGGLSQMDEARLNTFTDITKHAVFSLFIILFVVVEPKPSWIDETVEIDVILTHITFKAIPPAVMLLIYGLWYSYKFKSEISGKTAGDPYKGVTWTLIRWMGVMLFPYCFTVSTASCYYNIYVKRGLYEDWLNKC